MFLVPQRAHLKISYGKRIFVQRVTTSESKEKYS